jgi:putative addiction module killer protein
LRYSEGLGPDGEKTTPVEATPRTVTSLLEFDEWLSGLKDTRGKGQIEYRINKVRRGLIGEYATVGGGVIELILDNVGPGYRIYCVDDGASTLLLNGGTKRTQTEDIKRAQRYWLQVKEGKQE